MSQISLNVQDENVKWTDLNIDGRRLDTIIKQCYTKCQTPRKKRGAEGLCRPDLPEDIKLAYMDRLIKATLAKHRLIETVLGVKQLLKEANR